jgi:hypothetical protein
MVVLERGMTAFALIIAALAGNVVRRACLAGGKKLARLTYDNRSLY